MARQFIRAGDYGTPINLYVVGADGSAKDLSLATSLAVSMLRPDGTTLTGTPTLGTDGTDGWLVYTTQSGDFGTGHVGTVRARVRVVTASGSWSTGVGTFDVDAVG